VEKRWHLRKNGSSDGPYTLEQLSYFVKEGTLKRSSMVYDDNISRWVRAEQVKDLFPQGEPDMYGSDEEGLPDMTSNRNTLHELIVMGIALVLILLGSYFFRGFF